ncbi:2-phosphosulfolactate phosphatase [Effusibacillus lacus]|uniref:Probable 2-phosphosulfolactate phosphatase n=1 Tax=Effusibacillus lacus TaxID=1348429 RepID=A0A292YGJ7_9BACL|nr:2-phosphosulfolactate phosphatase [Effusibacillus lacus]TCS74617.1 2-phosphosulfolactate phosphatase [Effusibacillus lacus]GAX88488.1 2-phosphosulfolactate phosphatase [Effusibacillus lacus]
MRKIHVVLRKEDIDEEKISHCIAVVFDVLFATSSIATALHHGAREVIPAFNSEEALEKAGQLEEGTFILAGEKDGFPIDGFHQPSPIAMMDDCIKGKTVIYSTTNGTVAVRRSERAKALYASSLLNGEAVAERILEHKGEESVVLVCSGSKGSFCLEDFYGAGYQIDQLLRKQEEGWILTDAAKAAYGFYVNYPGSDEECLQGTRVGKFISMLGMDEATFFAAQKGVLPVVPRLENGRLIAG